jgi:hypothetical protein
MVRMGGPGGETHHGRRLLSRHAPRVSLHHGGQKENQVSFESGSQGLLGNDAHLPEMCRRHSSPRAALRGEPVQAAALRRGHLVRRSSGMFAPGPPARRGPSPERRRSRDARPGSFRVRGLVRAARAARLGDDGDRQGQGDGDDAEDARSDVPDGVRAERGGGLGDDTIGRLLLGRRLCRCSGCGRGGRGGRRGACGSSSGSRSARASGVIADVPRRRPGPGG